MKILICGMPRSMTTWAFNVIRELVGSDDVQTLWIQPNAEQTEREFVNAQGNVLAKCHHFSANLAAHADLVIYSYRDIRTAAVSYHRKFESPCTRGQLDDWVASGSAWLPLADIVLRYESVEAAPLKAVGTLRKILVNKYGAAVSANGSDESVLAVVDTEFHRRQSTELTDYDSVTMITPMHRTYQPQPLELLGKDKALYERVQQEFAIWLADYGYLHSGEHGQELEYQIATQLLRSLTNPVVVDVGVERGSFSQLAYESGAVRVVGFEPLPRHLEYLSKKFAGIYQVEIQPFAVSSRSGQMELHIATDLEGKELDFHHTLSDLGDSATVIRSGKALTVQVVSLADQAAEGNFQEGIDFLKIDTDGHDLSVLEGLGLLRPRIILAEYWDSLPETSGKNIYSLNDLAVWARSNGYARSLVVRRHGRIELVEMDAPLTLAGDWGNVFFLRQDYDFELIRASIDQFSRLAYQNLCNYVASLVKDCEDKEAEIQHLAAANRQMRGGVARSQKPVDEAMATVRLKADTTLSIGSPEAIDLTDQCIASQSNVQQLQVLLAAADVALVEKEEVIRQLAKALSAYRLAFILVRPIAFDLSFLAFLWFPINFIHRHARAGLRPRIGNLNQHPPKPFLPLKVYSSGARLGNLPKISIVTPSFKQGSFIERTLVSVLDQNYPNLEYFVQDGGSQDETVAVLEQYAAKLSGWVSEKDSGQSQAINRGFARTSGEIMAWLNSDDLLLPGALDAIADYFNRHPGVDVVYGNRILVDEQGMEIGRWILPGHDNKVLRWADYVPQESLFWRRSIWDKVGGHIDESFRFAMDWDLLVRFQQAGAKFEHIPLFLGAFRIHQYQKTSAEINEVGQQEMDLIRARILGRIPSRQEIRKALLPYLIKHVAIDLGHRLKNRLRFFSNR